MGGGHNSHASGMSKRKGTESNSRASQGKSVDGFGNAANTTDITTYNAATPEKDVIIAVRTRALSSHSRFPGSAVNSLSTSPHAHSLSHSAQALLRKVTPAKKA